MPEVPEQCPGGLEGLPDVRDETVEDLFVLRADAGGVLEGVPVLRGGGTAGEEPGGKSYRDKTYPRARRET